MQSEWVFEQVLLALRIREEKVDESMSSLGDARMPKALNVS